MKLEQEKIDANGGGKMYSSEMINEFSEPVYDSAN